MRILVSFLLASATALATAAVEKNPIEKNPIEIKEWPVPWKDSRPRDPDFVRPDSVWFVGQTGHYLASLNSKTGEFKKVDLGDEPGPHNLIVAKDGIVWYAGNLKGYIGRYDPKTSEIRRIAMPDAAATDPYTLVFDKGEKNIWFTVQGGNFVGRLNLASEKVNLIPVPTADARPYGIVVGADGTPWVALFGTSKLASVNPMTLALVEHALPRANARPRRLGVTADGRVWYVDFSEGYLGAFNPKTQTAKEWRLPGGEGSRPYAMAVDNKNRVWAVEIGSAPNRFVGFDPKSEQFFSITAVPSGAIAIRHVDYDGAAGQIWFGTDANTIGYAKVH